MNAALRLGKISAFHVSFPRKNSLQLLQGPKNMLWIHGLTHRYMLARNHPSRRSMHASQKIMNV
jgi:hypothetical protein